MSRIEELYRKYERHISVPWQVGLPGAQRIIFVVYNPEDERRLRAKISLFELATRQAGHDWVLVDITEDFPKWMQSNEYKDDYFAEPGLLTSALEADFTDELVVKVQSVLTDKSDESTVVGILGAATLFGLTRLSNVLARLEASIAGRLVVFFPGQYEGNHYRLLSGRVDWNYLAVPITLHGGDLS